jgi:hypothetical protein
MEAITFGPWPYLHPTFGKFQGVPLDLISDRDLREIFDVLGRGGRADLRAREIIEPELWRRGLRRPPRRLSRLF